MQRPAHSPFHDGFAALLHEPALLAAELMWRWCFAFSALALAVISLALFLDSVTVSALDRFLLATFQPLLLPAALRHIFHGSLWRFVLEQSLLVMGLTLLWSFAAAAGRAAVLGRLVAMFRTGEEPQSLEWHLRPIFVLQLLRAVWSLVAVAAIAGAFLFGAAQAAAGHAFRSAAALSFGVGLALIAGALLNWSLGLAPLFCIRNGGGARQALDAALSFFSRQGGQLSLLATGFLALRLVWAGTMCLAFLSPLKLTAHPGARLVALLLALLALVYFAGADLLRLAQWGAFVSLAEDDSPAVSPMSH